MLHRTFRCRIKEFFWLSSLPGETRFWGRVEPIIQSSGLANGFTSFELFILLIVALFAVIGN